jgi:hypothetical protein
LKPKRRGTPPSGGVIANVTDSTSEPNFSSGWLGGEKRTITRRSAFGYGNAWSRMLLRIPDM